MSVTLVDLDRWNPGSIRAVADAAAQRANSYRDRAQDQEATIAALEWEGISQETAVQMAQAISADMRKHADTCEQAARDVGASAAEVESITSEWSRIQHTADHWGITIDSATGSLHYITPDDPAELAEVEHHVQIVHDAIVDLLRRADSTDQHLTTTVNGAISDMADDLGTDSITSPQDARDTVEEALAGNKDAAGQVQSVFGSITPDQLAGREPLTPLQASLLSQMQAQQAGLSVEDLEHRGNLLGDRSGIISDSWQLMGNPDVHFPKTGLTPGDLDSPNDMTSGAFSQLPRSVQGC